MPYDKACGEGVMPAGVELLRELGVSLAQAQPRPFAGIRFVDGALGVTDAMRLVSAVLSSAG
jgi:hypothetical protein